MRVGDRRLPADYHMHTEFSDGEGPPAGLARRALELGLPEIGVCDHLIPASLDDGSGIPPVRVADYVAAVRAAAREEPCVRVLLGFEVDYEPAAVPDIAALLARHHPDYVIGSVHFVDGCPFDDPRHADFRHTDLEALWIDYFHLLGQAAGCGLFDVLGHVDLIKKFGRRPGVSRSVVAAARGALAVAGERGVAIEINTAGWRHAVGEQYPSRALLGYAHELGVPLTFGSDAHAVAQMASRFPDAVALARDVGYSHWLRLSDRQEVPFP